MLNPFQRACAEVYGGGDFAHVRNIEEAREAGDTLFVFLMRTSLPVKGANAPTRRSGASRRP
ncbi:hypothetical protein PX699_15880 [Sphingobium sp. H39-3-25]|uniref:hypothetical protein n=1 Tax=Sphingobium arseniciresistens TaxID=3030834 RepID=UPI0023B929FB|nr:hypothetical protein [Sphingobium arseniciresistens]